MLLELAKDQVLLMKELPYAPDAFYNADEVVVGYELSFTKFFYKLVELRPISEITAAIENIENRLKDVAEPQKGDAQ